jgi:hypothetical protein
MKNIVTLLLSALSFSALGQYTGPTFLPSYFYSSFDEMVEMAKTKPIVNIHEWSDDRSD